MTKRGQSGTCVDSKRKRTRVYICMKPGEKLTKKERDIVLKYLEFLKNKKKHGKATH